AAGDDEALQVGAPPAGWSMRLVLPAGAGARLRLDGFVSGQLTTAQIEAAVDALGERAPLFEPWQVQTLAAGTAGTVAGLPEDGLDLALTFTREGAAEGGAVVVTRTATGQTGGGITFNLAPPPN